MKTNAPKAISTLTTQIYVAKYFHMSLDRHIRGITDYAHAPAYKNTREKIAHAGKVGRPSAKETK
jgi:hypothetical protein